MTKTRGSSWAVVSSVGLRFSLSRYLPPWPSVRTVLLIVRCLSVREKVTTAIEAAWMNTWALLGQTLLMEKWGHPCLLCWRSVRFQKRQAGGGGGKEMRLAAFNEVPFEVASFPARSLGMLSQWKWYSFRTICPTRPSALWPCPVRIM